MCVIICVIMVMIYITIDGIFWGEEVSGFAKHNMFLYFIGKMSL